MFFAYRIKNIKKGDLFLEVESGINLFPKTTKRLKEKIMKVLMV